MHSLFKASYTSLSKTLHITDSITDDGQDSRKNAGLQTVRKSFTADQVMFLIEEGVWS